MAIVPTNVPTKRIVAAAGVLLVSALLMAVSASGVFAGDDVVAGERELPAVAAGATGDGDRATRPTARKLEVGMSLEEALEVLGKDPDSHSEIGAACGMLDVRTWDEDGTQLISVDGTVSSIVEGKNKSKP